MDASDAALDVLAILPALEPWLRQEIRSGTARHLRFTFPQIWQAIVVQVGHGRYHVGLEEDKTARELDPGRKPARARPTREVAGWSDLRVVLVVPADLVGRNRPVQ
jgi:hypothetical protein